MTSFDEVVNEPGQQLDEVTRHMAILATLLGCQGTEAFRRKLRELKRARGIKDDGAEQVRMGCFRGMYF